MKTTTNNQTKNFGKQIKHFFYLAFLSVFILSFSACDDDDDDEIPDSDLIGAKGVFILNQGEWNKFNAGITFYNSEKGKTIHNLLEGMKVDGGQDIYRYGNKIYASFSESGIIAVLNAYTKEITKTIEVKDENNAGRGPRYFTSHAGKIYASTYDGHVVRIDTTSLNIEATTAVGPNPEGIAYANGKLYVANSDGYNPDGPGKTLSVVTLDPFIEEKVLTVGTNPLLVIAYNDDVYLNCQGVSWLGIPGEFQRIDTKEDKVYSIEGFEASKFLISGNLIYYYYQLYGDPTLNVGIYNIKTETFVNTNFISDETNIDAAYGIGINPDTNNVYITDSGKIFGSAGKVYVFDSEGKKIHEIETGIGPTGFAFY